MVRLEASPGGAAVTPAPTYRFRFFGENVAALFLQYTAKCSFILIIYAQEVVKMNYPKSEFSCAQVDIQHAYLVALRKAGHLNLGMDHLVAAQIANEGLGPTKGTANLAFYFWNIVAFGVLGFTIYISFTSHWWWFIVGLVALSVIWKANKRGNAENLLDAAFYDEDFYERVRQMGGWIYQIDQRGMNALKIVQPSALK